MQTHRWLNQSQPRNLQNATILLYLNAALALFFGLLGGGIYGYVGLLTVIGIAGGYGIANDKKWGFYLSLVCAFVPLLWSILVLVSGNGGIIISLIFQVLLVVLLLSESSREYVRIWFK